MTLTRMAWVSVIIATGISVIVVVGWASNWLIVAQISPQFIPMPPSTALMFLLLCGSWFAYHDKPPSPRRRMFAEACALIVLVFCLTVLIGFLAGIPLDIEQLFLRTASKFGSVQIGRMSPITAAGLVLVSASLVISSSARGYRRRQLAAILGLLAASIGFVIILGYLFGAPLLYGSSIIPVALTTAIVLDFLGMGVCASAGPTCWPIRIVIGPSLNAQLLRGFLPLTIAIILLLSWFYIVGVPWIGTPAVTASLALLFALMTVIAIASRVARRVGEEILQTHEALRESEQRLRQITDNMLDIIAQTDLQGICQYASPSYKTVLGYDPEDMLGRSLFELVHPDDLANVIEITLKAIASGSTARFSYRYRHADGHYVWLDSVGNPILDKKGQMVAAVLSTRDITDRKTAEEASSRLAAIVESSDDAIIGKTMDGVITSWNQGAERLYGYSAEEAIGRPISILLPPNRPDELTQILERLKRGERVQDFETKRMRKDGKIIDVSLTASAIKDSTGRTVGASTIARDITERKRMEEELGRLAQFRQTIIDNANVWVDVLDEKANVVIWNKAAEAISGYSREEVVGHGKVWEWLYPDEEYRRHLTDLVADVIQHGRVEEGFETRIRRKDGQTRIISWNERNLLNEHGKAIGSIALGRDITERKQIEVELQLSESKYRSLVENATDLIFLIGEKDEIMSVNPAAARLLGRTVEEILGKSLFDVYPKEIAAMFSENVREVLKTGKSKITDEKVAFGGNEVWINTRLEPLLDDRGVVYAVSGVARNITERKLMEDALRESESRYRTLFDSTNDAIFIHDMGGKFLEVNKVACERLGYSREELLQMTPADIDSPEYAVTVPQRLEELRKVGHSFSEIAQVTRDGIMIPTELSSRIIDYKGTEAVLSVARDITQRKRLEAAVRESEERFRGIAERSVDAIFTMDLETHLTYVSPAMERILGYTPEEIELKPNPMFLSRFRTSLAEQLAKVARGEIADGVQGVMLRKDGSSVHVEINASPILSDGKVVGIQGILRDITERKKIESMKDQFVSMVSHELRTPLTSIRASLGLLASGVTGTLPEKGQRMLEIAVTNTDRLVRLINDILDSERLTTGKTPMEKKECSAARLVTQAADVMKPMAEKAGISLSVESQDASLWADPDRIIQALTNLISNAIKFSQKGGKICVASERKENQMLFRVQDEGRGIPPDKIGMLFERFQQVDSSDARERGGSGLGLSISRSIIEQHNGRIWVESTVGKGSTFFFTLPLLQEALAPLQPEATTGTQRARRVLIIEDDPDLAKILAAMLERHNIQSHIVLTGGKGIALSKQMHPDLIVLDLILPDMDGSIVVEDLRKDNILRSVPLVVYTVRELDEQQRENLRLGETLFFTKSRIPPEQFEEKVVQFMKRIFEDGGSAGVN